MTVYWDPNTEELSIDKPYSYRDGSYIRGVSFEEGDELVNPRAYIWGHNSERGRAERIENTLLGRTFDTFITADKKIEHHFPTFLITYLNGKFRRVILWEEWGPLSHYQIRGVPYALCTIEEREIARIRREDRFPEYYTSRTELTVVDRERLNNAGEVKVPTVVLDRSVLLPERWIEESITYLIKGRIRIDSLAPANDSSFHWEFVYSDRGLEWFQRRENRQNPYENIVPQILVDTVVSVEGASRGLTLSQYAASIGGQVTSSGRLILPPRSEESLREDYEDYLEELAYANFDSDLYDHFTE